MIIDKLKNAHLYDGKFQKAFDFLQNTDMENLENGKYEIDNDNIFVIIQDYQTKEPISDKWEAHKNYIDIQYIIKGQERLGYLNIDNFLPAMEYDKENDIVFGTGNGEFLTLSEGDFIIFMPQDVHMPGIYIEKPEYVKKAVVKVKV